MDDTTLQARGRAHPCVSTRPRGVIHRDLKPANIMRGDLGEV